MLFAITTTGKVVLLLVAVSFIVFALVTAMVLPKRIPGFPGRHLGAFITFTVLFFAAQMTAVWWVTGTQEVEKEGAEAVAGETMPVPTEPTTPETTVETDTAPGGGEGDPVAGKEVFLGSAGCGNCHTLADAGSAGAVGPNLDETMPPYDLVVDRVTNGLRGMPAFAGRLDETQIADVAAYVSSVAGS